MKLEKIKINQDEKLYEIKKIVPITQNILQITFIDEVPPSWGGTITIFTDGGIEAGKLINYETVYRDEGKTVYLSNNGKIYEAPDPDSPPEVILPPEPYLPTAEELLFAAQSAKRREVSGACEQIIYNGINVTLSDGCTEHYRLTEHDQINLFGKQAQLAAGAQQLEYHADGQPCRYYSAADMQRIIQSAMFHVSYHTTYCNALNMWIAGCEMAADCQEIFYGADVPEEYQSEVLRAYILQIAAMVEDNENETIY